jgi:hypothetical protein
VTVLTLLFGAELSLTRQWLVLAGCSAWVCSLMLSWCCVRLRAENRAKPEQCAVLERSCLGHFAAEAAPDERRLLSGWSNLAGDHVCADRQCWCRGRCPQSNTRLTNGIVY